MNKGKTSGQSVAGSGKPRICIKLPRKNTSASALHGKNSYFRLTQDCSSRQNYWGNLSFPQTSGKVYLSLKPPAVNVAVGFAQLREYRNGPSFTGGTGYAGNCPFKDTAKALIYLTQHFDLCTCDEEVIQKLNTYGGPIVGKC